MVWAMAIRTKEELLNFLNQNSQRRKHELITLKECIKSKREHEQRLFCRLAVVMAYAHWEGFVEESAIAYVEYVEFKVSKFDDLALNFQALAYKKKMSKLGSLPQKISHYLEIVKLADNRVDLDAKNTIQTKSNLNYENLENICDSIGIDSQVYWQKQYGFINELVANRCRIAHGGLDLQDCKYSEEVLDKVLEFIDNYSSDILNLAMTDAYIRVPPD